MVAMRYLVIVDKFAASTLKAIKKHDLNASITVVALNKEVAEEAKSFDATEVLEGLGSLDSVDYKLVDVATVWLESAERSCEVGKELKKRGVPLLIAVSLDIDDFRNYRECGFNFLVPAALLIEGALGSILGFDTWVTIPVHTFINMHVRVYRVFRRARLGISLQELINGVGGRSFIAVFDREGYYVSSRDYKLTEGDLIVVAAPTEEEAHRAVERLNKLFMLAERVYSALESRRPPG